MLEKLKERISKSRVIAFGDREIITEGLDLSFWADISHRCMTASWPSFIAGVVVVFIVFNAAFGLLYWLGDEPVSNVARNDYLDYLYFSIETLSTAGYGDMHPQTHYGHFVSAVELLTGIFSMSLMTGLIFARFSRPSARLLFVNNPVIATQDGKPTLMVRLANERHNIIGNATARLWVLKNTITKEGRAIRRFNELSLLKNEHPALALSWTLYHVLDEQSELFNLGAEDLKAANIMLVVVVSGYDVVAAQTIHARKSYDHTDIRFGQRYADILENLEDGRIRIDYGKFHHTLDE
ncbi:ion channel [Bradyrhizobium sp.]|uniref:ion channel n=1 Tax=Bradyrhizobium sp. TaxID=376 RepID=UPI003C5D1394